MPELRKTDHTARITWLGMVPQDRENIRSVAVEQVFATYAGIEGDFHAGLTRPACVRVRNLHAKGTEIRNTRQLSILSAEEMAEIAAAIATDFGFVGFDGFRRINVRRHSFALSARGLIDHVRR